MRHVHRNAKMTKKEVGSQQTDSLVDLLYSLSDALNLSEKIENSNARKKDKMELHIANALCIAKEFLIQQELKLDHDDAIRDTADHERNKILNDTK